MTALINPFPVSAYHGPDLFCDRTEEVKRLQNNIDNGVNTTFLSIRRMGKTALLHHLFHKLSHKRNTWCLYADIYATQDQTDFLNQFATAILKTFPPRKTVGKQVLDFITGLRPVISYDNLTGQPEISFTSSQPKQQEQSLTSLLPFLDSLEANVVIAFDEFQQIGEYPEKNTEALLRTLIQPLKNVRFIFSGSSKHVLTQMFAHNKRPFFGSTQMLELNNIDGRIYELFIEEKFRRFRRKISKDALQFVCEWTRLHTYYTQVLCNRLFADGYVSITKSLVQQTCLKILEEQEITFFQYRNLLTSVQWQVLKAIAREDKLYQPNAKSFISKHKLGTPSNIQRALQALMVKEMIYKEEDAGGNYYRVYDCFLARWLERLQ
jgi:uncharacterized protein